ncbi:MAG: hypothetical protein JNM38_07520 [Acidobacteria bacterium]|nr:hypothetical protein [Acidobacteriota bacterium]
MSIPASSLFSLVATIPERRGGGDFVCRTRWQMVDKFSDYQDGDRGPQLEVVDAGLTPDPGPSRPLVMRCALRFTTSAGAWTLHVDKALVTRCAKGDELHLANTGNEADVRRVIAEAAQRNLGGVATNFNVPTTALSFFRSQHVGRFTFTRAATRTIEGVETWALDFRETRSPTLVVTRDGDDVPMSGTVWVAPADGVVVRTRLRLRDFADVEPLADEYGRPTYWAREADYIQPQGAAEAGAATSTTVQGWTHAGPAPTASAAPPSKASARARRVSAARVINPEFREIDSLADIDVSYTREARSGMWLPAKMNEIYQGPLPRGRSGPIVGRIVGRATYAGYRHLDVPVRVTLPQ